MSTPVTQEDVERWHSRRLQVGVQAYPGEWPVEAAEVEEEEGGWSGSDP